MPPTTPPPSRLQEMQRTRPTPTQKLAEFPLTRHPTTHTPTPTHPLQTSSTMPHLIQSPNTIYSARLRLPAVSSKQLQQTEYERELSALHQREFELMCELTQVRMCMDEVKEKHLKSFEGRVERDQKEMQERGLGKDCVDVSGRRERFRVECMRFSRELRLNNPKVFIGTSAPLSSQSKQITTSQEDSQEEMENQEEAEKIKWGFAVVAGWYSHWLLLLANKA